LGSVARRFFFAPLLFSLGLAAAAPRAAPRQHSAKPAASRQRIESKCRYTGLQFHFSSDFSYSAKLYLTDVHVNSGCRPALTLLGFCSQQLSFPQQSKRSGYHRDSCRGGLDKQTHAPYKGFKPSPIATSYSCARRFLVGFSSSEVFFFTASFQPGLSSGNLRAAWRQHSGKEAARRQGDESKCRFTDFHFLPR